ncbi:MAG: UvrD-helicase domain-containing protein [Cyanobacteria bacterium J06558_2]
MLWLSVQWKINQAPNFSFAKRVFVDEAQDMSNLQLEFVLAIADARSKMLFVGDPSQSINGFCGADANSFENIKSRLSAKEFTLPTCYRCPKSHISLINRLYPEIPIIANDGAENGTIKVIEDDKLWATGGENRVEVGDLVVARRTSTLVDTHLELISRGIPSSLVGSSLCNELIELVREIFWQNEAQYTKFREFAQQYLKTKEAALAKKDNCSTALIHLQDLIKALISIYAHYSSCYRSCEELCQGIRALFGTEDNADTVILSTIHRAKGMEAEKVYILEPIDLPLLWENQQPWQEQQEHNLVYVALSRSTRSLYLVGDAVWFDHQLETQPSSSNSKIVKNHEKNATPLGSIEAFISGAQDNELEKIAKLIEHEQGKRIATKFHNEFSKN